MTYVYLDHFSNPVCPSHPAQHYIGTTTDVIKRHKFHTARIILAALRRRISVTTVRVWAGSYAEERRLKNWKNARELCPVCMGDRAKAVNFMEEVPLS